MSDSVLGLLRDQSFWYRPHGLGRPMRHKVAEMAAEYIEELQYRLELSDEIIQARGKEIERLSDALQQIVNQVGKDTWVSDIANKALESHADQ